MPIDNMAHGDGQTDARAVGKPVLPVPGTAESRGKFRRTIQSVDRALEILELLANDGDEMKLNEIAALTGLNVSTCHHLLSTLMERGYVGQNPRGRTYFLGNKVHELSSSKRRNFNLGEMAMPALRQLNRDTRESVHLAALQGNDLTTLVHLESPQAVRVGSYAPGKTAAAHATATGKAILAWLPETEIIRLIAEKGLARFTDKTIVSLGDLIEDLRHVRRNGFSVDDEEFQSDVFCLGVSIRDHSGAVIGSISCSMPTMRATKPHKEAIKERLQQCAGTLSEQLGSPDSQ